MKKHFAVVRVKIGKAMAVMDSLVGAIITHVSRSPNTVREHQLTMSAGGLKAGWLLGLDQSQMRDKREGFGIKE